MRLTTPIRQWLSRRPTRKPRRRRLTVDCLEARLVPAITGTVFQDFNGNGVMDTTATVANQGAGAVGLAVDRGLAGITVTGFDANGNPIGSVTTAADGTYTLPTPGAGQYRIQFSTIPAGFFDTAQGSTGTFSGTTAQFVANGGTANLGLVDPTDYSPDNPELFGVEAIHGDPTGPSGDLFEILNFNYNAGATHPGSSVAQYSNSNTHSVSIPYSEVGSVNAIAYNRADDQFYVAAFTKKFTGYGPGANGYPTGPNAVQGSNGALYAVNAATGAVSLLTDFNSVGMFPGSTGTNFRTTDAAGNPYDYTTDSLNTGWDAVGKTAFGGLDVSSDGKTLYVMNLGDRELYAVPLTGPVNSGTVKSYSLLPALPADVTGVGSAEGGALGDLRPFAVRVRSEPNGSGGVQDYVYIGAVNSAQFTQNPADLHGYVFRFDPVTGTFTTSPATGTTTWFEQTNMTYNRGAADLYRGASNDANWHPWTTSFVQQSPHGAVSLVEAQPWLTDLAFDAEGNLTLGYRDRAGDQSTNDSIAGAAYANQDGTGSGTRYEGYPDGEALRAFGSPTAGWTLENDGKGPGGNPQGSGVGDGFGPGGGQFYGDDSYPSGHEHIGGGMLLQLPGYPDIVVGGFDPTELGGDFRTGGFRWFDNSDTGTGGTWDKAYQLYSVDQAGTFQKENGIGGIAARIGSAPIEMGDRVWEDLNGNGLQDAGEPGIAGVTVDLFDPGGALVATAVTDANGNYLFSSGTGASTASALYGLTGLTADTAGFTVRVDNAADYAGPLAGLVPTRATAGGGANPDIDSNGTINSPTDVRAGFNTGDPGTNDHTIDFGFEPLAQLSGVLFDDSAENDGIFQPATDAGINGVQIALTGTDDLGNPVSLTTNTSAIGGQAGSYTFPDLRPSDAAGYTVTETGIGMPPTFIDGKDSPPGSLGGNLANLYADQVTAIPVAAGASGINYNFGEIRPATLTGEVFDDTAENDGLFQAATDPGINGVTVTLAGHDDQGNPVNLSTATTNIAGQDGAYQFTGLRPSDATGYTVTETGIGVPPIFVDGKDSPPGSLGGNLANQYADQVTAILVPAGANGVDYNFGEIRVPDLTIAKVHNGTFRQGDAADTYTLTVNNIGFAGTNGTVTVTDPLPAGLSPTAADNGTVNGWLVSFGGQTITATRSDVLAAGASYPDLTITVAVANNAPPSIANTATVAGGGEQDTTNDSGSDTVSVTQVADLVLAKAHNGTFRQGDAADTYSLTVSNTGPGPTTGTITVTDTLPAGLTPTAADNGTTNGWTVNTSGQTITATRSDILAAGANYPDLTVTVAVANNAPASIVNTATVGGGGELNTSNDSGSDTVAVTQVADLTVAKIHNGTFRQGDPADTYSLTVSNVGPGPTVGVATVTDPLPAGLSPTAADNGTINGWTVSFSGQTITATRSDALAPTATYPVITLTVAVANDAPASITNTATVGGGGELNTSNDSGSDTAPVTQAADVTITKVHNGTFRQGDAADTYTLTVHNQGPGPTTGPVKVTDTLPTGLSPTAADTGTINGWTVSFSGQTVTATRSDILASGASYPALSLTVKVAKNAPAVIANVGTVAGGGELNTANNTGTDTVSVLPPAVTIGRVLWHDVNGNGIQDPGEPGIGGVTVHLYSPTGQLLATAVTDPSGRYAFSDGAGSDTSSTIFNIPGLAWNSHYTVRLDDRANFVGHGPLAGLSLTSAFVGGDPGVDSKARVVGGVPTIDVLTGPAGSNTRIFNAGFVDPRDPGILTKRRFIH